MNVIDPSLFLVCKEKHVVTCMYIIHAHLSSVGFSKMVRNILKGAINWTTLLHYHEKALLHVQNINEITKNSHWSLWINIIRQPERFNQQMHKHC